MKRIGVQLFVLGLLLPFFGSCAVINSPIRVAEEAATATIRTAERTAELGIEILDEPFDEEEIEAESRRWSVRKVKIRERMHH